MKPATLACIALVVLGIGLAVTLSLHRRNDQLRHEVAAIQKQRAAQERLQHAPARSETRAVPEEAQVDPLTSELVAARAEIAVLEKRAQEQRVALATKQRSSAENRDPENGMTRLENLRYAGQLTPAAAVQTLLWASLQGDDSAMVRTITLDDAARTKAQAFIASLPADVRAQWPSPESFASLFISHGLTNVSAIQIVGTKPMDAQNVTVSVRGIMGDDQHLPMRLGASGWQLVVGEQQIDWVFSQLTQSTTPPP